MAKFRALILLTKLQLRQRVNLAPTLAGCWLIAVVQGHWQGLGLQPKIADLHGCWGRRLDYARVSIVIDECYYGMSDIFTIFRMTLLIIILWVFGTFFGIYRPYCSVVEKILLTALRMMFGQRRVTHLPSPTMNLPKKMEKKGICLVTLWTTLSQFSWHR
jgi:hypothetical protein